MKEDIFFSNPPIFFELVLSSAFSESFLYISVLYICQKSAHVVFAMKKRMYPVEMAKVALQFFA